MSDPNENRPYNPYQAEQDSRVGPTIWHLDPQKQLWEDNGFSERDAHEWQQFNFSPVSAASWRNAQINPREAQIWLEVSSSSKRPITPGEAAQWKSLGFNPHESQTWRRSFPPFEAVKWRRAGFDYETAQEWSQNTSLTPNEASRWARIEGMTSKETKEWLKEEFFDPDEVRSWREAGLRSDTVSVWKKVWKKELKNPPDYIDITGWVSAGLTAKEAAKWHAGGFGPAEADICIRANISMKQAQKTIKKTLKYNKKNK